MSNFLVFAATYGLSKCIKTMLVGTVFMAVVYAAAKINRGRAALVDYYALLLLPLALFSGMSRLFYVRPLVWVSAALNRYCTFRAGRIYFGVAFGLFAVYVVKNMHVHNAAFRLTAYGNAPLVQRVRAKVCAQDMTGIGAWYLRRVRIFVTDEEVSPHCGGILYPYVVLPERVCSWQEPSVEAVLCHELVHIRMGHIFVMALFRFLGCLWWVHPLVYVCERRLHELMEQVCDERVLLLSGVEREAYGQLLLGLVMLLRAKAPSGSAAFFGGRRRIFSAVKGGYSLTGKAGIFGIGRGLFGVAKSGHGSLGGAVFPGRSDFQVLHGRLCALGKKQLGVAQRRRVTCGFAAVLAVLALLLSATSYPRYTRITELSLYDEDLKQRACGTGALEEAVRVENGKLMVEPERFSALMDSLGIEGEHVYVSYGTIMKVPGIGGGGDAGMISLADYSDIFYLRADVWENDVMEFLLKYMI